MRLRKHRSVRGVASRGIFLGLVLAAALAASGGEPAFRRQAEEEQLIDAIRQTLLSSVEAEKSAVLSVTDEESLQMAREARQLATRIDSLVGELRRQVAEDARSLVIERFDTFATSWQELKAVDERLLGLAVANTNLKAARISAQDGMSAIDRFVGAVADMERASSDPGTLRTLSGTAAAALRVQSLLLIHIPIAEDAEMTRLEQQMANLAASVDGALARLRATPGMPEASLDAASSAWSDHRRIAADVIRLSRENTNVLSFDVSVHEKRAVTKQCLDALAALRSAVEASPRPNR